MASNLSARPRLNLSRIAVFGSLTLFALSLLLWLSASYIWLKAENAAESRGTARLPLNFEQKAWGETFHGVQMSLACKFDGQPPERPRRLFVTFGNPSQQAASIDLGRDVAGRPELKGLTFVLAVEGGVECELRPASASGDKEGAGRYRVPLAPGASYTLAINVEDLVCPKPPAAGKAKCRIVARFTGPLTVWEGAGTSGSPPPATWRGDVTSNGVDVVWSWSRHARLRRGDGKGAD